MCNFRDEFEDKLLIDCHPDTLEVNLELFCISLKSQHSKLSVEITSQLVNASGECNMVINMIKVGIITVCTTRVLIRKVNI